MFPKIRDRVLIAAVLFLPTIALAAPPKVNGSIEQIGPFRTVRVWGTPSEMGFAHGYLLAGEIVNTVDVGGLLPRQGTADEQNRMLQQLRKAVALPDRMMAELGGMLEGIAAKHGDKAPRLKSLGRPLSIDDLVLHNAGDLLRAFGCSGFTVWGRKAGDEGVITTRNFDFPISGKKQLDRQMILVRGAADKHQVATIAWPGYVGAVTGINDAGVCAFMHDGTGGRQREPKGRTTPVALTLANVLERGSADDAHSIAASLLQENAPYPFSYMIRIVAPRTDDRPTPERIFRIDHSGFSENPVGKSFCITTNHYLSEEFKAPKGVGEGTLSRYKKLEKRVGKKVTPKSAWKAQGEVASSYQPFPTLHTVVVYPEKRRLDLAFATWTDRVIAATEGEPTTISFAELFNKKP